MQTLGNQFTADALSRPEHWRVCLNRRRRPCVRLRPHVPRITIRLPKAYAEAVRACCRGEKPWPLLLLGSIGSGKTCAALLTADWTVGQTVMHTEDSLQTTIGKAMDGLLLDERPGASFDLRLSVQDVWDEWCKAELCVIDDLGQRRKTAGATDYIFRAIDSREHKPLIVTSNLTWDEIRRSDERLESRLEQTIVEAFGLPDQRCMK